MSTFLNEGQFNFLLDSISTHFYSLYSGPKQILIVRVVTRVVIRRIHEYKNSTKLHKVSPDCLHFQLLLQCFINDDVSMYKSDRGFYNIKQ